MRRSRTLTRFRPSWSRLPAGVPNARACACAVARPASGGHRPSRALHRRLGGGQQARLTRRLRPGVQRAWRARSTATTSSPARGGKAVPLIAPGPICRGKRVAVVDSGPRVAHLRRRAGEVRRGRHGVRGAPDVGGVLTYGIRSSACRKALFRARSRPSRSPRRQVQVNAVVGKLVDVEELLGERGFDAVFVATGAGLPSYAGIEGEGLNGVCVANELLTRVNLMKAYQFPEHGTRCTRGGTAWWSAAANVAMDALARHAVSAPGDGRVSSRSRRMPAAGIRHAEEGGVVFKT